MLTLACGFAHVLEHKRILSVANQDSDSGFLTFCGVMCTCHFQNTNVREGVCCHKTRGTELGAPTESTMHAGQRFHQREGSGVKLLHSHCLPEAHLVFAVVCLHACIHCTHDVYP